jgi:hypothetical protein
MVLYCPGGAWKEPADVKDDGADVFERKRYADGLAWTGEVGLAKRRPAYSTDLGATFAGDNLDLLHDLAAGNRQLLLGAEGAEAGGPTSHAAYDAAGRGAGVRHRRPNTPTGYCTPSTCGS